MPIKIAINGFGRIGRSAFKSALKAEDVKIVAVNDLMDVKTLAHLLQYDTVYGRYPEKVSGEDGKLFIGKNSIPVFSKKSPGELPWKKLKVDVVLECTGIFTDKKSAQEHIRAGAKKVIISAPAKDEETPTLIFGTEETRRNISSKNFGDIISNASCTTNCVSPVLQVLESAYGIEKALMTTVHSYTADQALVDSPHGDLRRARAAAQNIIPTSTGAADAATKVLPGLKNFFDGISIRVPTICVSISDITCVLKKNTTAQEVNTVFAKAAKSPLFKNILDVSNDPLVSSDFIGSPYSAIIDTNLTRVVGGNLVKIFAWYDNEWGYSMRLVEMVRALWK